MQRIFPTLEFAGKLTLRRVSKQFSESRREPHLIVVDVPFPQSARRPLQRSVETRFALAKLIGRGGQLVTVSEFDNPRDQSDYFN